MSWWRRALHLGNGTSPATPARDLQMEEKQHAATAELARQEAKLEQARSIIGLLRQPVDRLGEQVEQALRSIR